jgi:hypothetical protein
VEVGDHLRIVFERAAVLVRQDESGAAREPGEEEQEVVFEVEQRLHRQRQRPRLDGVVGREREAGHAAVGRDVLILLADRLLQPVDLDLAGEVREIRRVEQAPPVRVQGLQQRGGETARRAQPGSGRDVGERGDLDLRRAHADHLQRFADDRVMDLVDLRDVLELRVLEEDAGHERAHRRHVHVLVDRGRDDRSAVLPVVRRQVRAAAPESNPQRAARDDHVSRTVEPEAA